MGGGPGGAACALTLIREADRAGLDLKVTLYEGKDFKVHYNQCVGVLSPPLTDMLESELGLSLPTGLIKREIYGYRLHSKNNELLLVGKNNSGPTFTVRRLLFDAFLLEQAQAMGVEVVRSRVSDIEFIGTDRPDEVRIYSDSGYLRAQAVVGAFGLDETMLSAFEQATKNSVRYRRPGKYLRTFITKFHTDKVFIERRMGNIIYAFLMPDSVSRVEFGAITPKVDHLIINIAGKEVTSLDMDKFLELPQVRAHLPPFDRDDLHYFEGKVPTAPARNPYGDRFVIVGDATGWMRPFKGKGVNTALLTGIRAAQTMVRRGLAKEDFAHYAGDCKELLDDYYFGVGVRLFCRWASRNGLFDRLVELGKIDPVLYDSLFDSVSGEASFKNIIKRNFNRRLLRKLGAVFWANYLRPGQAKHY